MSNFKFTAGPWNVHTGADTFGPEVRERISFEDKVRKFKEIGLSGVQFHDDDAVPNMNDLSDEQIVKEAQNVRALLNSHGMAAEFVAPRLWEDKRTIDGGYTASSKEDREFAMWRSLRSIDIAKALGTDKIVLWLAREGTLCEESKNPVEGVKRIIDAVNQMLAYDQSIRILLEPKPNEPIDRSYCPTLGHVMAISAATDDPSRVGGLLEAAHAVLAGLNPANEIAFAIACGKLWGVHLNDQNGLRFDQDKAFGAENLRQAFNLVKVLVENDYGSNGEYVGFDVKAMRTQTIEDSYRHLENSIKVFTMLESKVHSFDYNLQKKLVAERNYEALEMYVLEHLLNG